MFQKNRFFFIVAFLFISNCISAQQFFKTHHEINPYQFEIVKGSNLVWNGNPYDADLNIDWPLTARPLLSDKDRQAAAFADIEPLDYKI